MGRDEASVTRRTLLLTLGSSSLLGGAGCLSPLDTRESQSASQESGSESESTADKSVDDIQLGDPELETMQSRVGVSFWVDNAKFSGDTAYVGAALYDETGSELFTGTKSIGLSGNNLAASGIYWDAEPQDVEAVHSYDVRLLSEYEYEQRQ